MGLYGLNPSKIEFWTFPMEFCKGVDPSVFILLAMVIKNDIPVPSVLKKIQAVLL
jgi:hypothetical protein